MAPCWHWAMRGATPERSQRVACRSRGHLLHRFTVLGLQLILSVIHAGGCVIQTRRVNWTVNLW